MSDDEPQEAPSDRVAWIIWGALVASIFLYGVVLLMVPGERTLDPDLQGVLEPALAVVALTEIGVIFWLRKQLFFGRLEAGEFDDRTEMEGQYFTTNIISWALAESIAIYGFILSFLGAGLSYYVGFALVAIALDIHFRPEFESVRQIFRSNRDATNS